MDKPQTDPNASTKRVLHPFFPEGSFNTPAINEKQTERNMALVNDIENDITQTLKSRGQENLIAVRRVLLESPVSEKKLNGDGSNNTVHEIEFELSDGGKLIAFAKSELGESFYEMQANGSFLKVTRQLTPEGEIITEKSVIQGPAKAQIEQMLTHRKNGDSERLSATATFYGIKEDAMPFDAKITGLKFTEQSHATKSEYVASAMDNLLNFNVIPQTTLRQENDRLTSYQQQAEGEELTSEALADFLNNKSEAQGAESVMRLACLDFLLKQTDRHINNIFYDKANGKYWGIDNGSANQTSVSGSVEARHGQKINMGMPVDQYVSIPLDMVYQDENWEIDEQALQNMTDLYQNIMNHVAYAKGVMKPEDIATLPEHVKQGRDAKTVSDLYRLLFEKIDDQGNPIPESTHIAKTEAKEFMKRLGYLITFKRPPKIAEQYYSKNMLDIVKIMLQRYGR